MNNRNRSICRFCLKNVYNNGFQITEESTKQIYDMLLLKPNLDIRTWNMICNECATKLQTAIAFKSACLDTEKKILPFIGSEEDAKLVLKEEVELRNVSKDQKICRFCKQLTNRECYTYLQRENMFMVDMVRKYIPELHIRVNNDLITCQICLDSLQIFLNFIMDLLDVEEKIKKNVDSLWAQIRFNDISDQIVKHEVNCREVNGGEFVMVKNEVENDDLMVLDNQEFNIKNEEIEIKSENDCDSFQHPAQGIAKNIQEFVGYTSESCLTSHIIIYKCKLCSYESKHKLYMERHIKTHARSSEIMYKHETFLYNSKLNSTHSHLTSEDPLAMKIFKCDLCSHETNRKRNLKLHLLTHHIPSDISMYKCEKCSYATDQKGSLKQHMIIHQIPSEINLYKCDKCSFNSKYQSSLNRHLLTHLNTSETTIYICQSCPFQSKHESSLIRHILTHQSPTEIKMFKCIHCAYEAPQKDRLRRHMLSHQKPSEVTMYKCELCSFETKRSDKLKRHSLTHQDISEVKVYNCKKCCYKTKRKDNIKQHRMTHQSPLENKIYKCGTCLYEAKYKRCLDKHMLTH